MPRKTMLALPAVCALTIVACSGTPNTALSPSSVEPEVTFLNPDGSTMKVRAPRDLSPTGTMNTRTPTLSFTNAVAALVQVNLGHELEVLNAQGISIYNRVLSETVGTTSHTFEGELPFSENFSWRVRARSGDQFGPWSATASIRTPDPPTPPPPPTGTLPFPIPEACGPFGPDGRFPCVVAIAAQSAEWAACARGNGVACHRFTRQVVHALSRSDPNFQMIRVGGGHGCTCNTCGDSGERYREDTTVYGGRCVYDMIVGAGGSSPSLQWGRIGCNGPRAGDLPADAPLCTP